MKICDTPLRYEIKYLNQNNISQIIATIKDISKGLKSEAFVYLDVQPYDTSWVQVVNEIEDTPFVKCIVTIRQDDWNRCFNKVNTNLHYSTLAVDLTEFEAKDILIICVKEVYAVLKYLKMLGMIVDTLKHYLNMCIS